MIFNRLRKPQWVALAVATPLFNAVGSLVIMRETFGAPLPFALVICTVYLVITLLSVGAAKRGRLSPLLLVINGVSLATNAVIFVLIHQLQQRPSNHDIGLSGFSFVGVIFVTAILSLLAVSCVCALPSGVSGQKNN
jgi:hypothetical protein